MSNVNLSPGKYRKENDSPHFLQIVDKAWLIYNLKKIIEPFVDYLEYPQINPVYERMVSYLLDLKKSGSLYYFNLSSKAYDDNLVLFVNYKTHKHEKQTSTIKMKVKYFKYITPPEFIQTIF